MWNPSITKTTFLVSLLTLSLPNVAKGKFPPNLQISFSKILTCESTDRELSFQWSHHRISSIDSKVRVTLQNSIKHSGSERVKCVENHYVMGQINLTPGKTPSCELIFG